MDSANFWGVFGGLAVALGLFPGTVAVAQVTPDWSVLLSNPWFKVAIGFWAVGVVALLRMAWLRTAHLYAEGHRCPDPEAHTRPRITEDVVRHDVASGTLPPRTSSIPAQAANPITGTPQPPKMGIDRIFVGPEVTFETLFALYDGKMDAHVQAMADFYIGKFMPICRPLVNLRPWTDSFSLATLDLGDAYTIQIKTVILWIRDKYQFDRVSVLPIGASITLHGRISKISRHTIELEDCELVEERPVLPNR